jgi:hypothetical protein
VSGQCVRKWQREFENGRPDDSSTGQMKRQHEWSNRLRKTDGRQLEINPLHWNYPSKLHTSLWQMEEPDFYCNGVIKNWYKDMSRA